MDRKTKLLANISVLLWLIFPPFSSSFLQELYLMRHQIKEVTALSNLKHLYALVFQDNQVIEVQPISNLTKLRTLDLDSHQITNINLIIDYNQQTAGKLSKENTIWARQLLQ